MVAKAAAQDSVTEQAAQAAHEAIDRVAATEAEERIRKASADAERRLKDTGRRAQQRGNEMAESVSGYAHEHPLATAGIAFAAGFLLASLFRR